MAALTIYSRKEIIDFLGGEDFLPSSLINDDMNETIETNEMDLKNLKSELEEAFRMTLEKYSESSQKLMDFLRG